MSTFERSDKYLYGQGFHLLTDDCHHLAPQFQEPGETDGLLDLTFPKLQFRIRTSPGVEAN
jgi:hypothetical protein